ncbi:MAG: hypothetical protein A3G87_05015 [Omnitrophica bacterium RIFCSPLOWO2_12_FULL_50_11]|nr:MAG: hypothetical protein A3G87_05015 [Omnitrophica bacterium RIFCSPLOWO2_12_FULL_50_11]
MGWSGFDQRSFPRVQAKCDIRILQSAGGIIRTKTENLGAGGVRVILEQELEKLSRVHLRVTLPGSSTSFHCDGRIVWTVRSTEPRLHQVAYDTGIEFLNLRPEDKDAILTFTENQTH